MFGWIRSSLVAVAVLYGKCAFAQGGPNSSLFRQTYAPVDERQALSLANTSFTYQQHHSPKELKIHDYVMVTVSENSTMKSKGDVDTKRHGALNAKIANWVKFKGFSVHPDPLSEGDPSVTGTLDAELKGNAELKTNDSLQFRVAAEIVDVRPSGAFVVEAHKTLRIDEETWEYSLSGLVRREDVLPNNEVKSERIAELQIFTNKMGQVRDAYRRGWLTKIWDSVSPF